MTDVSQIEKTWSNWRAYHLVYHADRTLMLRTLLYPLLVELLEQGLVDRFFFVRYGLGGPHIRLRWRLKDEASAATAEAMLAEQASKFFSRWPSTEPQSPEKIRAVNRSLLSVDRLATETDTLVYNDNSWHRAPVQMEVERYGGPEFVDASLDLFCLSTIEVLELLQQHSQAGDGWKRTAMMGLALKLAWSLARSEEQFRQFVAYGKYFFGNTLARCVKEGEDLFAKRSEDMTEIMRSELKDLASGKEEFETSKLALGAAILAAHINSLEAGAYQYIAVSHIHMTANRLGILNPEEAYLSAILLRAVDTLRTRFPEEWHSFWKSRTRFFYRTGRHCLNDLIAASTMSMCVQGR